MQVTTYRYRPSPGDRMRAIGLALAVCALIFFMLIRMGLLAPGPGNIVEKLTAVTLRPQGVEHTDKRAAAKAPMQQQRRAAVHPKATPQVQPRPTPTTPVPWIKLSRDEFAASDISRIAKHPGETSSEAGAPGGNSYGPGEGPGGAQLYNVSWYREPTWAELVTYMPHRDFGGDGWADIACRMIEHYHVEDCRELDESPRGSGLARSLRQAAWQFLVRPPSLNGRPLLGTWVRIHYTFKARPAVETSVMPGADNGSD